MIIHQIQYKDTQVEISVLKNQVMWNLNYNENNYGNSVTLLDKKTSTIIGIVGVMVVNAIETYEKLISQKNGNSTN